MIDLNKLREIPLPTRTDSYTPVGHADIIEAIYEQLDKSNLKVVQDNVKFARNGEQMIGTMTVESFDKEVGFMLAVRNSYDKSMTLGLGVGGTVFVCSNGMIKGDIKLIRKHTGSIDREIKHKIVSSINQFEESLNSLLIDREVLKTKEITRRTQAELIGRMYIEQDIITSTQVNIIKRELVFSENFKDMSMWSLYNHVTESLKQSSVSNYLNDHIKLHNFLMEEVQ